MNYLAIFIGGGLGSLLRYGTTVFLKKYSYFNLPLGTLVSNILASFLLGILVSYFASKTYDNKLMMNFLMIGLCGGFSTFSTFSLENFMFINNNQFLSLFAYIVLSVLLSVLFIYIGFALSSIVYK